MLSIILFITHICLALLLIGLILIQKDQGVSVMAIGGASQTIFGSRGSASFLFKLISFIIFLFFLTSLGLGFFHPDQHSLEVASLYKSEEQYPVNEKPAENTNAEVVKQVDTLS